jgi:hypothetical protein
MAVPDRIKITHQRPMITPTIRAALNTFQRAANRGTAVYLSPELVRELREALKAEPEPDDGDDAIDRWIKSRPGWPDDWPAVTHSQLTALIGEALEHWGLPAAPPPLPHNLTELIDGLLAARPATSAATLPAPEPGEVGQLVAWLKEEAEAYLNTCGTSLASQNLDNAATLIQQQEAELAALRGVPVAVSELENGFMSGVCAALATVTAHSDSVIWREIVRSVGIDNALNYAANVNPEDWELAGFSKYAQPELGKDKPPPAPQAGEVQPPHPTYLDAIRLAQGCHDYQGGHSGQQGEAFQDGVGTVVTVLKRAAVGPWDSQTKAVFGVGSAPQAGEGEGL